MEKANKHFGKKYLYNTFVNEAFTHFTLTLLSFLRWHVIGINCSET